MIEGEEGRDALRELLRLYDFQGSEGSSAAAAVATQLIEGVAGVQSRRVTGRIAPEPGGDPAGGFCRGVEITIELDESKYQGTGAFLFASVLERFFGLYASLNSFTQLVAHFQARRESDQAMAAAGGSTPPGLKTDSVPDAPSIIQPAGNGRSTSVEDHAAEGGEPWNNPLERPLVRLEGVAAHLFERPFEFSFYQAVRLLHRLFPDREPVGHGSTPDAEPVRFRTLVSLSFPPSAVYDLTVPTHADPVPVLTQTFLGFTGPSGILPRHYTELLIRLERETRGQERTALRDWLDVFNNRLVGLFYRSWEKYRYYLAFERGECDRDEPDSFTQALLSLVGLGQPMLRHRLVVTAYDEAAGAGSIARVGKGRFRHRRQDRVLARVDDLALLYYAGFFAGTTAQRDLVGTVTDRLLPGARAGPPVSRAMVDDRAGKPNSTDGRVRGPTGSVGRRR